MGTALKNGALKIFWGFVASIAIMILLNNIFSFDSLQNLELQGTVKILAGQLSFYALFQIGAFIVVLLGIIDIKKYVKNAMGGAYGCCIAIISVLGCIVLIFSSSLYILSLGCFIAFYVLFLILSILIIKDYIRIANALKADCIKIIKLKKKISKFLIGLSIGAGVIALAAILPTIQLYGFSFSSGKFEIATIKGIASFNALINLVGTVIALVFTILYYVFLLIALYKGGENIWIATGEGDNEVQFVNYPNANKPNMQEQNFYGQNNPYSSGQNFGQFSHSEPNQQKPNVMDLGCQKTSTNQHFNSQFNGFIPRSTAGEEMVSYAKNVDRENLPETEGLKVKKNPNENDSFKE